MISRVYLSAGLNLNSDQKVIQQKILKDVRLIIQLIELLERNQDSPDELDDLLLGKASPCISGSNTNISKNCPKKLLQEGSCGVSNPDQDHIQQKNQEKVLDIHRKMESPIFNGKNV